MLAQTFGRLRAEADGTVAVRFERVYDYTVDELWAAITEPEQIRGWLGETELEGRPPRTLAGDPPGVERGPHGFDLGVTEGRAGKLDRISGRGREVRLGVNDDSSPASDGRFAAVRPF